MEEIQDTENTSEEVITKFASDDQAPTNEFKEQEVTTDDQLSTNEFKEQEVLKIEKNSQFLREILEEGHAEITWKSMDFEHELVEIVQLETLSDEYSNVKTLFYNSFRHSTAMLLTVSRIQNPYLLSAYLLKKEEIKNRYGFVSERDLFHGTSTKNAELICKNNFNWRLHGTHKGNRFGQGVSFSPDPYYSGWSCDLTSTIKVMLLTKVLVANFCVGTSVTKIPPPGYDTTHKPSGDVVVKYEDDTFYPTYEIKFKLITPMIQKARFIDYNFLFDSDSDL